LIIIPAIDIRDGKCVRLIQGSFEKESIFNNDPIQQAILFKENGAKYLHVIDLDGAKNANPQNKEIIVSIKNITGLFVECGGGIREIEHIKYYLDKNIDNIILGSLLFNDSKKLETILTEFNINNFTAGFDFFEDKIKISGWQEDSYIDIKHAIEIINHYGFKRLIFTDIRTDGMLSGPNLEKAYYIRNKFNGILIASGGISNIQDIVELNNIGIDGCILGMSLYKGKINLKEAISLFN